MIVLFYILGIIFSITSFYYIGDEQHIVWCTAIICALLAYLNAGVREKK